MTCLPSPKSLPKCSSHPPSSSRSIMATSSSRPTPAPSTYDEFVPAVEWSQEERPDAISIHLPGFKRDNVRVQLGNYDNLIVSGERPIDGTRKSRFQKDFTIPERCNVDDIHATFQNEVLYIVLPKKKAAIQPAPQTTTTEPQPKRAPENGAGGVSAAETAAKQRAKTSEIVAKLLHGARFGEMPTIREMDRQEKKERTAGDGKVVGDDKGEEGTDKGVKQADQRGMERKAETTEEGVERADKRGMEPKAETVTSESLEDETGTKAVSGLTKPRAQQLLLNVAVAILVLMGLAMFATYKLAKTT